MTDREPYDLFLEHADRPHFSALVEKPGHTISREHLPVSARIRDANAFASHLFLICNTRVWRCRGMHVGGGRAMPLGVGAKVLEVGRRHVAAFGGIVVDDRDVSCHITFRNEQAGVGDA